MEFFQTIWEFPNYEVSNYGNVRRKGALRNMAVTPTTGGALRVNLAHDRGQHTRSVAKIVALEFVPKPHTDRPGSEYADCDTPIHKDGNLANNRADNLAWRPRWFAWKYARQFEMPMRPEFKFPVENLLTREAYASIVDAGLHEGMLWEFVYQSALSEGSQKLFPTNSSYAFDRR